MHCELVVPALFAGHEVPRLPALELLLARGRTRRGEPVSLERWLARAFGLEEHPVPAGAISLLATGGIPERVAGDSCWLRADPVHLRVEHDRLTLIPGAGFSVSREEADALTHSLNQHFGGELEFVVVAPDCWCVRAAGDAALEVPSPLEVAGGEVDANLPRGPDAARWRARMNEVQMAFHDHQVNRERERQGAPPVNSVWFWGAGRLPPAARGPWQSVSANEPVAAGLGRLAAMRQRALPAEASSWLERSPEEGRHLLVLDGLRGALALGGAESHASRLAALEAHWFGPLLEALRGGRVGMLTVHAPDAGIASETVRGDLRRFWRRARPLGTTG